MRLSREDEKRIDAVNQRYLHTYSRLCEAEKHLKQAREELALISGSLPGGRLGTPYDETDAMLRRVHADVCLNLKEINRGRSRYLDEEENKL